MDEKRKRRIKGSAFLSNIGQHCCSALISASNEPNDIEIVSMEIHTDVYLFTFLVIPNAYLHVFVTFYEQTTYFFPFLLLLFYSSFSQYVDQRYAFLYALYIFHNFVSFFIFIFFVERHRHCWHGALLLLLL